MSRPDRERIRAVRETVYNLFVLISDDGLVRSLGAVAHELGGSDESKLRMLQAAVDEDLPTAQAFPVPHRFVTVIERLGAVDSIEGAISFDSYSERFRDGSHLDLFEELLEARDGLGQLPERGGRPACRCGSRTGEHFAKLGLRGRPGRHPLLRAAGDERKGSCAERRQRGAGTAPSVRDALHVHLV